MLYLYDMLIYIHKKEDNMDELVTFSINNCLVTS